MDSTALRELQAPLKAKYREDAGAALVTLRAEGDLDFRGTLGVERSAPVGFRAIRLGFALDTDEPQDRIDSLLKLTERYCVVLQTLRNPPEIMASVSRRPG